MAHHGRNSASNQRGNNYDQIGGGSNIAVSSRRSSDYAVRSGNDVHIKVEINFQGAEDDSIHSIDIGSFGSRIRILAGGNLDVGRRGSQRGCAFAVERLHVHDGLYEP